MKIKNIIVILGSLFITTNFANTATKFINIQNSQIKEKNNKDLLNSQMVVNNSDASDLEKKGNILFENSVFSLINLLTEKHIDNNAVDFALGDLKEERKIVNFNIWGQNYKDNPTATFESINYKQILKSSLNNDSNKYLINNNEALFSGIYQYLSDYLNDISISNNVQNKDNKLVFSDDETETKSLNLNILTSDSAIYFTTANALNAIFPIFLNLILQINQFLQQLGSIGSEHINPTFSCLIINNLLTNILPKNVKVTNDDKLFIDVTKILNNLFPILCGFQIFENSSKNTSKDNFKYVGSNTILFSFNTLMDIKNPTDNDSISTTPFNQLNSANQWYILWNNLFSSNTYYFRSRWNNSWNNSAYANNQFNNFTNIDSQEDLLNKVKSTSIYYLVNDINYNYQEDFQKNYIISDYSEFLLKINDAANYEWNTYFNGTAYSFKADNAFWAYNEKVVINPINMFYSDKYFPKVNNKLSFWMIIAITVTSIISLSLIILLIIYLYKKNDSKHLYNSHKSKKFKGSTQN